MSSISAKISIIPKSTPDQISQILASISDSIKSGKLSKDEMDQLCNELVNLLKNSKPINSSVSYETIKNILSGEYPESFPNEVLLAIKPELGDSKKKNRNLALNFANELIEKVTPTLFWNVMHDCLNNPNKYMKECALQLFHQTVLNFPDFKTAKYLRTIFSYLKENDNILRMIAYNITKELYFRRPEVVENLLNKQFSIAAKDTIAQLKSEKVQQTKKSTGYPKSYIEAQNTPQISSNQEIETELIQAFEELYPDYTPDSSACDFQSLKSNLKRSADWQDRMEALQILLKKARGTQKPDKFVKNIQIIQDEFTDCLTDQRSALFKSSCIVMVGLAQRFRGMLDQHSDWMINKVISKASNGTFIISKSAEFAVTGYIQFVQGKYAANAIKMNVTSSSQNSRMVALKAMIIARQCWTQGASKEFIQLIAKLKSDPDSEIRKLASNPDISSIKVPLYNIKEIKDITKEKKEIKKEKKERKEIIEEPQEIIEENTENLDQNEFKDISAPEKIETQEEKVIAETPKEANLKDELNRIYEQRNTKELCEFLQNNSPDLMGYMQNAIDLVVMDLNEEEGIENAVQLLKILCEKYVVLIYPFISQILLDLPEDEVQGQKCLEYLAGAIGEIPLARLLRQSNVSYATGYILNVVDKFPNDINFQTSTILKAVANKQFEKYHSIIFSVIKNIYEQDPIKCEALFASMPQKDREEILEEMHVLIPSIYQAFNTDTKNDIPSMLAEEIDKAKKGEQIDFDLLLNIEPNETSHLLLAIAAIRETQYFDPRFIEYLIGLTNNTESAIVGAATIALQKKCHEDPHSCMIIANSLIPTSTAFKTFAQSIQFSDHDEATEAMSRVKDQLIHGLDDISTKYSVLSVLANASKYLGDEYQVFCGNLSKTNQQLLTTMISSLE